MFKKFFFVTTIIFFVACKHYGQIVRQDEKEKIMVMGNTQFSIKGFDGGSDIWNNSGTGLFNSNSNDHRNYNFDLGRPSSGVYTSPTINLNNINRDSREQNKEFNEWLKSSYKESKWVKKKIPSNFSSTITTNNNVPASKLFKKVKSDPKPYYDELNKIDTDIQNAQVHYVRYVAGGVKHIIPGTINLQFDTHKDDILRDTLDSWSDIMVYNQTAEKLHKKKDIVFEKMKKDNLEDEMNQYKSQDKYARGKPMVKGKPNSSMSVFYYERPKKLE